MNAQLAGTLLSVALCHLASGITPEALLQQLRRSVKSEVDPTEACLSSCSSGATCRVVALPNYNSCEPPPASFLSLKCRAASASMGDDEFRNLCLYAFQKVSPEVPKVELSSLPTNCDGVKHTDEVKSGVYLIAPDDKSPFSVYCRFDLGVKPRMVVQRRMDGSENFYRNWNDYRNGFGNLLSEFWLGNDRLSRITNSGEYNVEFYMEAFDKETAYAEYSEFVVNGENQNYLARYDSFLGGSAGDSFVFANGMKFTTYDRDNDKQNIKGEWNCAVTSKGGWWYNSCHACNPNGMYFRGAHQSYGDGINWLTFRGMQESLTYFEMRLIKQDS